MNRSNCWLTYFLMWVFLVMTEANKNMDELVGISLGKTVQPGSGKWPFMVAFFFRNATVKHKFVCAGSLIHDRAILTAAHCLIPNKFHMVPKDLVLLMGNENFIKFEENRIIMGLAQKFVIHPDFLNKGDINDIAIIKLRWSIPIPNIINKTITVDKVCLPPTDDEWLYDKTQCIAMGWGLTEKGYLSSELREAILPVVDDDTCRRYQPEGLWYNPEIMFCAGYKEGGKDTCKGDSGGPFMCPLKSDPTKYVQLGIISNGNRCGVALNFGYYTRVTHYLNWIKEAATFDHDEL